MKILTLLKAVLTRVSVMSLCVSMPVHVMPTVLLVVAIVTAGHVMDIVMQMTQM